MRALLGVLIGLLVAPAPAWGQTAAAVDGLESIADSPRYRASAARVATPAPAASNPVAEGPIAVR